MDWQAWVCLGVIISCIIILLRYAIPIEYVFGAGLVLLIVLEIVSIPRALSGLMNEGVLSLIFIYAVAAGLKESGALDQVSRLLLGEPVSLRKDFLRILPPVLLLSPFINNTPIVASYIPIMKKWCEKYNLSLSNYLIPISYSAILGGTWTIIGTSTNLIINGMLIANEHTSGLSFFFPALIGIPVSLIVLGIMISVGVYLLPKRKEEHRSELKEVEEYTTECIIEKGSKYIGKTIKESNLKNLPKVYLVQLIRQDIVIDNVSKDEELMGGDRLVFIGDIVSIISLLNEHGIKPASDKIFGTHIKTHQRSILHAVIAPSHPCCGLKINRSYFRERTNAVILAIARNGKRIEKKIGDTILLAGDILLLEAPYRFYEQNKDSLHYLLLGQTNFSRINHQKAWTAWGIFAGMVGSVIFGFFSLLTASMIAYILLSICKCTSYRQIGQQINWSVITTVIFTIGLVNALHDTGVIQNFIDIIYPVINNHLLIALISIYVITWFFTEILTNTAAAILTVPIALTVAQNLDVSYIPFVMAIIIASSCSFSTPYGYQTNLMVYGAGGYSIKDFFRIGIPLSIVTCIATVIIISIVWDI